MIEAIRVSNMGPFAGTQEVRFPEGLVLIEGRYINNPLRSNRAGKSYILDLIRFALYGKYRHDTKEKLAHRKADSLQDPIGVSLLLSHPELDSLSLSRNYDPVPGRYLVHSPQFADDMSKLKAADQQDYLDGVFQCTYDEAEVSWMVLQGDSAGIMRMSMADRKTFLLKMFSPTTYDWPAYHKEAATRHTSTAARLNELRQQRDTFMAKAAELDTKAALREIQAQKEIKKEITKERQDLQTRLAEVRAKLDPGRLTGLKQKRDDLTQQKTAAAVNLAAVKRQYTQVTDKLVEIATLQDALVAAQKSLDEAKSSYDEDAVAKIRVTINNLSKTAMEKAASLKEAELSLKKLSGFLDKGKVCPVTNMPCSTGEDISSQYAGMVAAAEALETEVRSAGQQRDKYSAALLKWEDLGEEIAMLEANILAYTTQIDAAQVLYSNKELLEVQIMQRTAEAESLVAQLKEAEKALAKAQSEDEFAPRKEIVTITDHLKQLTKQEAQIDDKVAALQGDIKYVEQMRQTVTATEMEISRLEKRLSALSSLRVALGKDGIPFFSLVESLHVFELEVNRALHKLGTNIRIEVSAYKTLTTLEDTCQSCGHSFTGQARTCLICGSRRGNKRQETLAIQMRGVSYSVDFSEDSGGGMLLVSLAIRLALFTIYRERGRMKGIDFWFLDEVFSPLDVSARNNMLQFLDDLRDTYELSQLFLISHTDMSDMVQPAVVVERNEEMEESYLSV